MTDERIAELATQILNLVGYEDDNGDWWGHDTNLGNCHEEAVELINAFIDESFSSVVALRTPSVAEACSRIDTITVYEESK